MSALAARAIAALLAGTALTMGAPAASARPMSAPPPPSYIATSAAEEYEQLRAEHTAPTASQPVVEETGGFDLASAAIGAAAAGGLVIVLVASGARLRPVGVSTLRE